MHKNKRIYKFNNPRRISFHGSLSSLNISLHGHQLSVLSSLHEKLSLCTFVEKKRQLLHISLEHKINTSCLDLHAVQMRMTHALVQNRGNF